MLPNIATVMALCVGLSSIRFGLQGRYHVAVVAVLVAAVLDAMDGRLARLLGASSDFGAELDSLSDFVSFGVAPSVLVYILSLHELAGLGWAGVLFFSVCMGLRLARFNTTNRATDKSTPPPWSKKYFIGVPAPAGALLALLPLMLQLATGVDFMISPFICLTFLIVTGFLMVSRLPTYSFKTFQVPSRLVLPTLLIVGLMVAFLLSDPWLTMSIIMILYLFSIPHSYSTFKKLKSSMSGTKKTSQA
jgi:CDP-diacylglycerol--serine O-phosphatidyltransferase